MFWHGHFASGGDKVRDYQSTNRSSARHVAFLKDSSDCQ